MKILSIDSSALGGASVSRELTAAVVSHLTALHPDAQVIHHDLAADPVAHFGSDVIGAIHATDLEGLTPEQRAEKAKTDTFIEELLTSDVVVLGAPMYNFTIPSQLKAWLDRVLQAGRTFRYTESGPVGLAGGRKVILVSTRGGRYANTPLEAALDYQEAYLMAVLSFIGITDVSVIRAESTNLGVEARAQAIEEAKHNIHALVI